MCDRGYRYNRKEELHPEKIKLPKDIWVNPEKYADPRMKANFLLFRKLTPEKRSQLSKCSDSIIDYMRKTLHLQQQQQKLWLMDLIYLSGNLSSFGFRPSEMGIIPPRY